MVKYMGLKNKLKAAVGALSTTQQAILTFFAAALPPVIVLMQEQAAGTPISVFLYGAALLGGALATVVFLMGGTPEPVPTPTPAPAS